MTAKPTRVRPSLLAALLLLACAAPAAAQEGERPRNLKVLPSGMTREQVIAVMRGFTNGLGVRCTHCHAPYDAGRPDSLDFASDANPTKDTARRMMRMVRAINQEYLAALAAPGAEAARVECVTCHRGAPRPLMLEDTLRTVVLRRGADSAVAAYRQLRARHYGRFTYDFGERPLTTLATRLAAEGRPAEARRMLELNAEQFPESAGVAFELGRAYETAGERERAIEQYRKALRLQPGNRQAQQRLQQLTGGGR